MSLIPTLIPFLFEYETARLLRFQNQHYGLTLTSENLPTVTSCPIWNNEYHRPWRHLAAAPKDVSSNIKIDKDKFQVSLDVQHFSLEEILVKMVDGNIVVEGNHEEKKDEHGYISRRFTRLYTLPDDCVSETIESRLSSDGVLTIIAPRKVPEALQGEREIPNTQTRPVRNEVNENIHGDK